MKKYKNIIIGMAAFVLFIAATALGYNYLSENYAPSSAMSMNLPQDDGKEPDVKTEEEKAEDAEKNNNTEDKEAVPTVKAAESEALQEEAPKPSVKADESEGLQEETPKTSVKADEREGLQEEAPEPSGTGEGGTEEKSETEEASSSDGNQEEEKTAAPDFKVYDNNKNEVFLSSFKGKPTVINFWATWCGPCKSELPAFERVWTDYKDEVNFLMVNMTDGGRETVDVVEKFVAEEGYKFPVYFDSDMDAAMTYGIYSIPVTVFIDKDGFLLGGYTGAMSEEMLRYYVDYLF